MKSRLLALVSFACLVALSLTAATAPASKPEKPLHISRGAKVDLADYAKPGQITVFDFYSDYCPPCVRIAPLLEKLHKNRADIVVVKVDVNRPGVKGIDWRSPVVAQFKIRSIPHFKIYGTDGKLQVEDVGDEALARAQVLAWAQ